MTGVSDDNKVKRGIERGGRELISLFEIQFMIICGHKIQ